MTLVSLPFLSYLSETAKMKNASLPDVCLIVKCACTTRVLCMKCPSPPSPFARSCPSFLFQIPPDSLLVTIEITNILKVGRAAGWGCGCALLFASYHFSLHFTLPIPNALTANTIIHSFDTHTHTSIHPVVHGCTEDDASPIFPHDWFPQGGWAKECG